MSETGTLRPEQSDALFDILTHHEAYSEIEDFKSPNTIRNYGPPFQDEKKPTTPILQSLLSRFILRLPSLRDISPDFWKVRIENIIYSLSAAELSESYDKGILGIRKTLATAISGLIEYPARGILGGFPKDESSLKERSYDKTKPDDVLQGFQDFLQQLVYGDLFDKLYARAAETDDLTKHGDLTQAAHEFVVVNLASFMHYTLVLSPEGPALLRMVENVHKMAPYTVIRQTLRIGNVATMISGMMRIILAKMSVASITNWMGISSGADEGMNLLQQIISTVLGWDKKELKKRCEKVEKDKNAPSKEARDAIKAWTEASRDEHLETRNRSREQSMSIVYTILSLSSASAEMSEAQHALALEYLSLKLAIRDRQEIIRVLCQTNPDHMTEAIRTAVSAYEPMIRQVHQAVDLSATVGDLEAFMNDMIKLSKQEKTTTDHKPPSVEDYVKLLHDHQGASHRFLHQVCKNGKEVAKWFQDYCHEAASHFRQPSPSDAKDDSKSLQTIPSALTDAFSKLDESTRSKIRPELSAHATYLQKLHESSAARISEVIRNESTKGATPYGPGSYLAKWQDLLDSTLITPDKAQGPVRKGGSKSVKKESAKDVDGTVSEDVGVDRKDADKIVQDRTPDAPSVEETVKALGGRFREMLIERV